MKNAEHTADTGEWWRRVESASSQNFRSRPTPDIRFQRKTGLIQACGRKYSYGAESPSSVTGRSCTDSSGILYVANGEDNRIRKISPEGVVSTMDAQQFIEAP